MYICTKITLPCKFSMEVPIIDSVQQMFGFWQQKKNTSNKPKI